MRFIIPEILLNSEKNPALISSHCQSRPHSYEFVGVTARIVQVSSQFLSIRDKFRNRRYSCGVSSPSFTRSNEGTLNLENEPHEPPVNASSVNTASIISTTRLARYYLRLSSPRAGKTKQTESLILIASTACHFLIPMEVVYTACPRASYNL